MTLETQFNLKKDPIYIKFLREHSYWYKTLNRKPESFNSFIEDMKVNYKMRPIDKISRTLDYMDIISGVLSTLR